MYADPNGDVIAYVLNIPWLYVEEDEMKKRWWMRKNDSRKICDNNVVESQQEFDEANNQFIKYETSLTLVVIRFSLFLCSSLSPYFFF